jgi:protein-tyrosine phosphatase
VKDCGRRLFERIENRRAEALRRKPAGVARRLRAARSVLILCQGNVIRSVYAAELLGTGLRDKRSVAIQSAGLATEPGWQAHPRVIARCRELGVDVTSHGSKAVTEAMVRAADVVLVMEIRQILAIIRRFPVVRRKTFLLTCLAPDVPIEIADPAGRDDASVDACLDHVVRAVTPMIDALAGSDGAPA